MRRPSAFTIVLGVLCVGLLGVATNIATLLQLVGGGTVTAVVLVPLGTALLGWPGLVWAAVNVVLLVTFVAVVGGESIVSYVGIFWDFAC